MRCAVGFPKRKKSPLLDLSLVAASQRRISLSLLADSPRSFFMSIGTVIRTESLEDSAAFVHPAARGAAPRPMLLSDDEVRERVRRRMAEQ